MSKYLYSFLLLFFILSACKKSKTPTNTTITVYLNGDSIWTSTNVITQNMGDGTVYITGISADQDKFINLTINNSFRPGDNSYPISNYGTGTSPGYSAASYEYGGYGIEAITGQIVISNYGVRTIQGSFDFSDTKSHVTGTFSATTP